MFEDEAGEYMSVIRVRREYENGRRDFSEVTCNEANFSDMDLRGIIFRNAKLNGSSFEGADLTDADFSGAKMKWSGFVSARLINTNFTGTDVSYCSFNNAIVRDTIFVRANVSYSLFFNVSRYSADFTDANKYAVAWSESDLDAETHKKAMSKLGHAGFSSQTRGIIKENVKPIQTIMNIFRGVGKAIASKFGYKMHDTAQEESSQVGYGSQITYGTKSNQDSDVVGYDEKITYGRKKED